MNQPTNKENLQNHYDRVVKFHELLHKEFPKDHKYISITKSNGNSIEFVFYGYYLLLRADLKDGITRFSTFLTTLKLDNTLLYKKINEADFSVPYEQMDNLYSFPHAHLTVSSTERAASDDIRLIENKIESYI